MKFLSAGISTCVLVLGLGAAARPAEPPRFTPLVPLADPAIVASSVAYPGGGYDVDNMLDGDSGLGLNDYFYVAGRDPREPKRSGAAKVLVAESGPLAASLLVLSDEVPGCRKLSLRLFNTGQEAAEAVLEWPDGRRRRLTLSNPAGEAGREVRGPIPLAPLGIVTLHAEPAEGR